MMFDGVTLPAFLFVCITMVMALIGNSVVLLVFGCRWRTTNDTKIYIMALAALDLLCATVTFPRVLISLFPVSQCLVKKSHMRVFCKLSTFFTAHLNITSALILVAIAASRYVKVTKRDSSSSGRSKLRKPGACNALKASLKRIFRSFKTVRGAKISVGVALGLAALQTSPFLVLYGSGENEPSFMNTSELVSNGTAEDDYSTCHTSCRHDIHWDYKVFMKAFDISQFVLFAILAMLLIGIYSAILRKLCHRKRRRAGRPSSTRQDNSCFGLADAEPTISSMEPLQHKTDETSFENQSPHSLTTTESVSAEEGSTQPASPSSVDVVINHRPIEEKAMLQPKRARPQSEFVQYRNDNPHELTLFPPLSYTSEHWSDISLNMQTSQTPKDHSHDKLNNRLSTASFQLVKTGNQAKLTTLVFLLVTVIYIVSYCPYFVYVLLMHTADPEAGEPWQRWGVSGQAMIEIFRKSYLFANAANPLVYGLCNPYFREQLGKLLICRRDVI